MKKLPFVFIIESVKPEEKKDYFLEGYIISRILHLGGYVESKYYYVKTKDELENRIAEFGKSNFKYLHLSCHGWKDGNCISTQMDDISFRELRDLLKPYINNKRLFLSSCYATNDKLAKTLILPPANCLSIIGFDRPVAFDEAAIIWASFYYSIFKEMSKNQSSKMERQEILSVLGNISKAFNVRINYFSHSKSLGYKQKIFGRPIRKRDLKKIQYNR